jgi:hypothetical protein
VSSGYFRERDCRAMNATPHVRRGGMSNRFRQMRLSLRRVKTLRLGKDEAASRETDHKVVRRRHQPAPVRLRREYSMPPIYRSW